ncbi:hypothetical protein EIP73_10805 [Xylella fastidiosa subsp. pauca]|nr:hypothetical protein EIP73_10805 [Xylella fastidiosa subsp. pauca]TNW26950.1 hypothetical protein EIP74_02075 [Xylella fastidiosa subsp. pauca]
MGRRQPVIIGRPELPHWQQSREHGPQQPEIQQQPRADVFFRYPRQNSLAVVLHELGRIERTLFILNWLQNVELLQPAKQPPMYSLNGPS